MGTLKQPFIIKVLLKALKTPSDIDTSPAPIGFKVRLSILFGLLSLILIPYSLHFQVESVQISITSSQLLPILITLAFGPIYGFLSGIFGGMWYPFFLWQNNGWANLLTALLALGTFTLIGWAQKGKLPKKWFGHFRLILAMGFCFTILWLGYTSLFNPLLRLNPPFWYSNTISSLPMGIISGIIIKNSYNLIFLVTLASLLLRINGVRKIFSLPNRYHFKHNHIIGLSSFIALSTISASYALLVHSLIDGHTDSSYLSLAMLLIFQGGMVATRVIMLTQENHNKTNYSLRKSEEKYRLITENAHDLVCIIRTDGIFEYISPSLFLILGYTIQELLGKQVMDYLFPDDRLKILGYLGQIRDNNLKKNNNPVDFRFLHKSGHWIWLESYGRILTDTLDSENNHVPPIAIISRDITDRKENESLLRATLAEKNVLLRELYHRTKNNMQTIASMVALKIDENSSPEYQALTRDVNNLIQSMSLVHTHLYESGNLSEINMSEYIPELTHLVERSFTQHNFSLDFKLNLAPLSLSIEMALPCGMVLNELLTNSFKYAFNTNKSGVICIKLEETPTRGYILQYSDNGPGLSPQFSPEKTKSIGLLTTRALVESQLGGTLDYRSTTDGLFYTICWNQAPAQNSEQKG